MSRARSGSIGRRFSRAVLITSVIGAAVVCVGFAAYQFRVARAGLLAELVDVGGIVGSNAMLPLVEEDLSAVESSLQSFASMERIEAAAAYTRDGALFARFARGYHRGPALPERAPRAGNTTDGDRITHVHALEAGGEVVGTILLRASTAELRSAAFQTAEMAAGAFVLCLAPAFFSTRRLRRELAAPLAALAHDAERLARGDWSERTKIVRDDEIGVLATAFDEMAERLRRLMSEVADGAHQMLDGSHTLRDASRRSQTHAETQNASVDRTAEAMTRMETSLDAVTSATDRLSEATTTTAASASEVDVSTRHVGASMDTLFGLIEQTASALQQSVDSVRQIDDSADHLERASAVAHAALVQLGHSVGSVSDAASRSLALSSQAAAEAKRGHDAVGETVAAIGQIDVRFAAIQSAIGDLAGKSQSIGDVVEVIDQVATETNLLSLNASIVAARAGEHGRSFAVVAAHIGNLAKRTARSTSEIAGLIRAVQKSTKQAVTATTEGNESVALGVQRSQDASGLLTRIIGVAEETASTVGGIADASRAQSAAIGSVESAFRGVRDGLVRIRESIDGQRSAGGCLHGAMQRTSDVAAQVKNAAAEQTRAISHIAAAIREIAAVTEEVRAGAHDQSRDTRQIIQALGTFREVAASNADDATAVQAVIERLSGRAELLEASLRSLGFEDEERSPGWAASARVASCAAIPILPR